MKTTSICRRCHRLRPVNLTRCCAGCSKELRDLERRRPMRAAVTEAPPEGEDRPSSPPPAAAPKPGLVFMPHIPGESDEAAREV